MSCRVGRRGPRKKGCERGANLFHAVRSGRFLYASAILACADVVQWLAEALDQRSRIGLNDTKVLGIAYKNNVNDMREPGPKS